jgi:hypothetical protein
VTALLADSPAAPPPPGAPPPAGASDSTADAPALPERTCAHCGAPLGGDQEWCLQCGACEPASLRARSPRRPLAVLAALAAILAVGAAVAGAAALTHEPPPHRVVLLSIVAPTQTTPTTPGGTAGLGAAGGTHPATKGHSGNLLFPPASSAKPPKIPAATGTPGETTGSSGTGAGSSTGTGSTGETTTTPEKQGSSTGTTGSTTGTSTTTGSTEGAAKSEQPTPILLDTNAATTYNPYEYPATGFGDPALAIDGEPSTAWTAQVQPATFPNLAMGLLIDLRTPTKVAKLELATPTRGMTVQVYGANGAPPPATITTPGWVMVSGSHVLKKKVTHLRLHTAGKPYRYVLVWIVKAPAASQGTPTAPGHVALSEVALFPPVS